MGKHGLHGSCRPAGTRSAGVASSVLVVLLALVAFAPPTAGAAGAAAGESPWRTFGSARTDYSVANAYGKVDHPTAVRVTVESSTPKRRVHFEWQAACLKDGVMQYRSEGYSGPSASSFTPTPFTRTLDLPVARPDLCAVSARAQAPEYYGTSGASIHVSVRLEAQSVASPPAVPGLGAAITLPDVTSVRLAPGDLPSRFRLVPDQELAGRGISVAELGRYVSGSLAKAHLLSFTLFANAPPGRLGAAREVEVSYVIGPLTKLEQLEEAGSNSLSNTAMGRSLAHIRDAIEKAFPGLQGRGELGLGADWTITETSGVFVVHAGRAAPGVSTLGESQWRGLSDTLDTRLREALGLLAPAPKATGFRPTGTLVPKLTTEIPTPLDVSTDANVAFANLLLAGLATLLFTIAMRLLNKTLAAHEGELERVLPPARWAGALQQRADRVLASRVERPGRADLVRIGGILLFYVVVFSLLEPGWNPLTIAGLCLFVYMAVAVGTIGIVDDLAVWRAARRWGLPAKLAVRPALALVAVASTAATRIFGIVPGIMIGTPDAFPVDQEAVREDQFRRLLRIGGAALLLTGTAAWMLSAAADELQRAGLPHAADTAFAGVEAFLVVVFAVTVQNLFVQLLAFPGSIGAELQHAHRRLWATFLVATSFLFLHTLLNPSGSVRDALTSRNVIVFLATAGGFTLVTLVVWLAFRRADRSRRQQPPLLPATAGR